MNKVIYLGVLGLILHGTGAVAKPQSVPSIDLNKVQLANQQSIQQSVDQLNSKDREHYERRIAGLSLRKEHTKNLVDKQKIDQMIYNNRNFGSNSQSSTAYTSGMTMGHNSLEKHRNQVKPQIK